MREKEVRQILVIFSQTFGVDPEQLLGINPGIELVKTLTAEILMVNGEPLLARSNGVLYPTLVFNELSNLLPKIVVDMGAVSYICRGADIMAPGVVQVKGDFVEKTLLLIVDERYKKSLAIGIALFNSKTINTLKRGKIAKNLHYVGDKLWDTIKTKLAR